MSEELTYPVKPGDWLGGEGGNHYRLAKVKAVYPDAQYGWTMDLWLYDVWGNKTGRESPPMGGPRTYEPCCTFEGWERIPAPDFPLSLKVKPDGSVGHYAGEALPHLKWKPKSRRNLAKALSDDSLRKALERIADGDNDPRATAAAALGRAPRNLFLGAKR